MAHRSTIVLAVGGTCPRFLTFTIRRPPLPVVAARTAARHIAAGMAAGVHADAAEAQLTDGLVGTALVSLRAGRPGVTWLGRAERRFQEKRVDARLTLVKIAVGPDGGPSLKGAAHASWQLTGWDSRPTACCPADVRNLPKRILSPRS